MNKSIFVVFALFLGACPNPQPLPADGDSAVSNADGSTITVLADGARVLPDGAILPTEDAIVVTNDADAGTPPTDADAGTSPDVVHEAGSLGAPCSETRECQSGLVCSGGNGLPTDPSRCNVMPRCGDVQGNPDAGAWVLCALADGGTGSPNLPPGQAFDPYVRAPDGGVLNGVLPDGGNPMEPPLDTVPWSVPYWENLYNDDWSWTITSGSGNGTTENAVMSAGIRPSGVFGISVPFVTGGMMWSSRDGAGYFWSKWSSMGVPGSEYCRGEWIMDGTGMQVNCWVYPNNPLTTPGAPTSRTILGGWSGDHRR